MANPFIAALFGALGGGYEGHQQDVAKRERLADRATIGRSQRQSEILRKLQLMQAGVRDGPAPLEPPPMEPQSVGTPDALPGISRVPAPDPNMGGGKDAALRGLSPSQTVKRQQEMVDEDYGAPSGTAPIATAETPHNLAARAPAPSRPRRYLPLDQNAYVDTQETPEARTMALQQEQSRNLTEQRRTHLTQLGYNPQLASAGAGSQTVYEKMVEAKAMPKAASGTEPNWQTVETTTGFQQINPRTGQTRPVPGIQPYHPPKDAPKEGPPAGEERKAYFFYQRAQPAAKIIDTFNDQKALDALSSKAGMLGNWTKTAEGRRLIQAGKTWAMAVLRQDSGGAITDDEMDFYFDTYLPRPNDDPDTLTQKAEARRVVTDGLLTVAGRAVPKGPGASSVPGGAILPPSGHQRPAGGGNPFEDLVPKGTP